MTEAAPITRRERRSDRSRTKAIVAIAAGAVLLFGGGTTLAYWSTTQSIDAGTVQSGDLKLEVSADAAEWTITPEGGDATPVTDIDTLRIVPGDTVTMTQTATLTLVGDNLEATLTADLVDAEMPADATAPVPTVTVSTAEPVTALTEVSDGETATVTVNYVFPNTTKDHELTNATFDFGGVDLTLTQNTP